MMTIDKNFDEDEVDLTFDFQLFKKTFRVKKEVHSPAELAVVVLQKNNPISWIKSWCKWYKKLYNAKIFFYDNGSENFSEVCEEISEFNPTIVKWDFTFGPATTAYNLFCQIGAYNHFFLKYVFDYGMVFDIDEYLISKVDLLETLKSQKDTTVFLLNNYYIPNIRKQNDRVAFGIENFHFRPEKLRNCAFKYIFRQENTHHLQIHRAIPLIGRTLPVAGDLIYFNHYKGLTTNWKPWDKRNQIDAHSADLVPDIEAQMRIKQMLEG